MTRGLCVAVAILGSSAACQRPPAGAPPLASNSHGSTTVDSPTEFPLWWSKDLDLATLDGAAAALDRHDPVGFGELSKGDDARMPQSCREWYAMHAAGYEAMTTIEMQGDDGARVRCGTLSLLTTVKPATSSHVRQISFESPDLPSILPAEVATAVSDDEYERRQQATAQHATLANYDPKARISESSDESVEILEGDGSSVVLLRKQAMGDFNGDGVEDLVLSVVNAMTEGTLSSARLLVFTRKTATGALRAISPPISLLPR